MKTLLAKAPRFLFFTGKGGVGKTSMSCTTSVGLAGQGRRVLLISTDPASNLDEVLDTPLGHKPVAVNGQDNLWAMNIDPVKAAEEYRERIVGPYRGVLPEETVRSIEEQLSGACTVEIASFNEFTRIIGDDAAIAEFDHVVLDTAPTGHTLRLLSLPSAWNDFILENKSGSSCLGPMSGLQEQRAVYEKAVASLTDAEKTLLVLVTRAEEMTLKEAARASGELGVLGMNHQHLIVNGIFDQHSDCEVAQAFAGKSQRALDAMPDQLAELPRSSVGFNPHGLMGVESLRETLHGEASTSAPAADMAEKNVILDQLKPWRGLLDELSVKGSGLIMTMGKGGVGKTSVAAAIALELAERGFPVQLSTTDPAAHVQEAVGQGLDNLTVSRIDPKAETEQYVAEVLEKNRATLSEEDLALLEEELRSPCIEEIAVFQSFAKAVAQGHDKFMVLDTAPTGHTLLLLDATEAYHREVGQNSGEVPEEVRDLLPRLRDPEFTKVLITTLPEATPVHEAARLQQDLRRAEIEPFGWVINQSFAVSGTRDELLMQRGSNELKYIDEVCKEHALKAVISPWLAHEVCGPENLRSLLAD